MKVFARFELSRGRLDPGESALLLEGHWPGGEDVREPAISDHAHGLAHASDPPAKGRWSLDGEIDSRFHWIDQRAAELAEQFASAGPLDPATPSLAWLNIVKLRYFLLKLLRVAAYFSSQENVPGADCELFFEPDRDRCYVLLLQELAQHYGFELVLHAIGSSEPKASAGLPISPTAAWRHGAETLLGPFQPALASKRPRVLLCGNPRLLAPICRELIGRGMQPWWIVERFAPRSWLRWRSLGAGLVSCDGAAAPAVHWPEPLAGELTSDTQSHWHAWPPADWFAPAVEAWLWELSAQLGSRQAAQAAQIAQQLDRLRPMHVVLDQDGSPFNRAVVAAARQRGLPSSIVQHGAPFIRFGFAPLVADYFCAWGKTSRTQLLQWEVADERICITGSPTASPAMCVGQSSRPGQRPRFVMLATLAPADSRPDAVNYHLTRQTHAAMIRDALAAVSKWPGSSVVIKLHPRDLHSPVIRGIAAEFKDLRIKIVGRRSLNSVLQRADCVLSCASSAGIEAAAGGWPVIQLMPEGSGDLLDPNAWRLVGTARSQSQLEDFIHRVLAANGAKCQRDGFDGHCRQWFGGSSPYRRRFVGADFSAWVARKR